MLENHPEVIYIMGYGRSGSTLLDVILSNHPDVVSAGALINFFDWLKKGHVCACGETLVKCEFWGPVVNEFLRSHQGPELLKNVQSKVEARGNLQKLLSGKLSQSLTSQYKKIEQELFTLVGKHSGEKFVLDSSKSARLVAGRAYSLTKYTSLEVKPIYLVRDGRAVVWSAMKRSGSPERKQSRRAFIRALNALAGWILTNKACLQIVEHLGEENVLIIRYEDLMNNPTREIQRIGAFLELPMNCLIEKIEKNASFSIGHNLGGNRLRLSNEITICPDFSWKHHLPRFFKLLFWIFAWPLSKRFGYAFNG